MTDTQSDYTRTDQLDKALIPLEIVRERLGVSRVTLWRRMKSANIKTVTHNAGAAITYADLLRLTGRRET